MARFGRDIVRSLTQPGFADQVSDVGMLLGGLPGKRREEEARQDRLQRETDAFTIYEQGLRSSEDANVAGVTAASKKLSGMLTDEVDETVRSDLMTKISALGKLQETTQTAKDQRNITDLIQAENLLDDLEQKGDARTENENAVMEAVQQRVDQLRQVSSVVSGAAEVRRNARITELTKREELATAESNAMKRDLSRFVGTAQFAERAQRYRDMGLSQQVDELENKVLTIMTERQDLIDKLNERAPLTKEEERIITDLGFKLTGDIKTDRKRLNIIKETKFQKELDIALRPLDPASAGLAKALVKSTLEDIVKEGEIEQLPIAQDLSDKVEDILEDPEELEVFLNRVEGASPVEIDGIVRDYLRSKFPKRFAEMETEMRRKATVETTRQGALADIAASTNAARGTAAFEAGIIDEDRPLTPDDEGYFDLSDPDDADRALMLYERQEATKKKTAFKEQKEEAEEIGTGMSSRYSGFGRGFQG
jgi:hypothetical protein